MRPRKRFGQHFLEPAWVIKLVAAVDPQASDRILEIGPGRGALTEPLAARAERVVGIEVDRDLAATLTTRGIPNVTIVNADVLTVDLEALVRDTLGAAPDTPARVVGNLPYNISSPILFRLLSSSASGVFTDATLMLQREVADRLVADPSTREYGVLTLSTAIFAEVTLLLALPPGAFRPAPKVRSAVVRLRFRPSPVPIRDRSVLIELIRSIFTQRRKTLANALSPMATRYGLSAPGLLEHAGIDPTRRPETLTLEESARLSDLIPARKP
jgi:16S rRNA (adenine1518-N6/adenine1519-N6)-dimethyltransferase